jgi:hypothetical protein
MTGRGAREIDGLLVDEAGLIGVATILFDNGIEQKPGLASANRLDGNLGDGCKQLRDFLRIGDLGVFVVGVGVNERKHGNAPPGEPRLSVGRFLLQNK